MLAFAEKGPTLKKRIKGFTFGYTGRKTDNEDESKKYMPGPGYYYGKEAVSTFSPKSTAFSFAVAGSTFIINPKK